MQYKDRELYQQLLDGKLESLFAPDEAITIQSTPELTQRMLIVRPAEQASERSAAIMLVHGGGFAQGKPEDKRLLGRYLALTLGMTVFSASYRLYSDKPTYPAVLGDIGDAWCWIQQNAATYNIDPQRTAIGGASAGGYLATMASLTAADPTLAGSGKLGTCTIRPKATVCHWGPLDFVSRWFDLGEVAGPEKYLFGGSFTDNPELYYQSSPLSRIDAKAGPALFIYGRQDTLVAPRQGLLAHRAWQNAGNHSEYYVYDNVGHETREDEGRAQFAVWSKTAEFLDWRCVRRD